ncbi:hypothetical protein FAZ15_21970 [Sphingobacterium olei]|uniref:Uncharacterized protein n=1 Tax=Sphingobacterium olei TaxID=2571155 RepID=A0A4U0N8I0_9SPHI|nr:hypothetical protein [Sphingobacterium olei]TJZ49893.1 hypothetical protein FAZ15_21970 [Sphingobacterium olei]
MTRITLVLLSILLTDIAVGQEFFSGTKNTTGTISRTGITNLGFAQFRNNPTIGATVLEHTNLTGDIYIRSVGSVPSGDVGNVIINDNAGFVGIGTTSPREKLSVNGNIRAKEIKVEASPWPDYVFESDYSLLSLEELESYIQKNKHLPDIPKAEEAEKDGVSLGEMNRLLLKKIEELTLYLIDMKKEIEELKTSGIREGVSE